MKTLGNLGGYVFAKISSKSSGNLSKEDVNKASAAILSSLSGGYDENIVSEILDSPSIFNPFIKETGKNSIADLMYENGDLVNLQKAIRLFKNNQEVGKITNTFSALLTAKAQENFNELLKSVDLDKQKIMHFVNLGANPYEKDSNEKSSIHILSNRGEDEFIVDLYSNSKQEIDEINKAALQKSFIKLIDRNIALDDFKTANELTERIKDKDLKKSVTQYANEIILAKANKILQKEEMLMTDKLELAVKNYSKRPDVLDSTWLKSKIGEKEYSKILAKEITLNEKHIQQYKGYDPSIEPSEYKILTKSDLDIALKKNEEDFIAKLATDSELINAGLSNNQVKYILSEGTQKIIDSDLKKKLEPFKGKVYCKENEVEYLVSENNDKFNKTKLVYEDLVESLGEEKAKALYTKKDSLTVEDIKKYREYDSNIKIENYKIIDFRDKDAVDVLKIDLKTSRKLESSKAKEFQEFIEKDPFIGKVEYDGLIKESVNFALKNIEANPELFNSVIELVKKHTDQDYKIRDLVVSDLVKERDKPNFISTTGVYGRDLSESTMKAIQTTTENFDFINRSISLLVANSKKTIPEEELAKIYKLNTFLSSENKLIIEHNNGLKDFMELATVGTKKIAPNLVSNGLIDIKIGQIEEAIFDRLVNEPTAENYAKLKIFEQGKAKFYLGLPENDGKTLDEITGETHQALELKLYERLRKTDNPGKLTEYLNLEPDLVSFVKKYQVESLTSSKSKTIEKPGDEVLLSDALANVDEAPQLLKAYLRYDAKLEKENEKYTDLAQEHLRTMIYVADKSDNKAAKINIYTAIIDDQDACKRLMEDDRYDVTNKLLMASDAKHVDFIDNLLQTYKDKFLAESKDRHENSKFVDIDVVQDLFKSGKTNSIDILLHSERALNHYINELVDYKNDHKNDNPDPFLAKYLFENKKDFSLDWNREKLEFYKNLGDKDFYHKILEDIAITPEKIGQIFTPEQGKEIIRQNFFEEDNPFPRELLKNKEFVQSLDIKKDKDIVVKIAKEHDLFGNTPAAKDFFIKALDCAFEESKNNPKERLDFYYVDSKNQLSDESLLVAKVNNYFSKKKEFYEKPMLTSVKAFFSGVMEGKLKSKDQYITEQLSEFKEEIFSRVDQVQARRNQGLQEKEAQHNDHNKAKTRSRVSSFTSESGIELLPEEKKREEVQETLKNTKKRIKKIKAETKETLKSSKPVELIKERSDSRKASLNMDTDFKEVDGKDRGSPTSVAGLSPNIAKGFFNRRNSR